MTVYRICSSKYPANDGEGARVYGGRWNHKGTAVVYCAATASLCALEVLANSGVIPSRMLLIEAKLPDTIAIQSLDTAALPSGWNAPISPVATKDIGARWIGENKTAVLSVPSAVIPFERNYLLNPKHPDFALIKFKKPKPFIFDSRLK